MTGSRSAKKVFDRRRHEDVGNQAAILGLSVHGQGATEKRNLDPEAGVRERRPDDEARRAAEIEPDYAPAYAGMAMAYIAASTWIGLWPSREGVPKGKEIALKAIQLDPALADGYIARAWARYLFDWDWDGAEKDLKKALELNPNSTLALDAYSGILAIRGRFEEAAQVMRKALEVDPLSPGLCSDLGWVYFESAQFDRGIPHFRKALELDRNFHPSRQLLAFSYQLSGKSSEAAAEFQTLAQLAPDSPYMQGSLGYFFGVTDRSEEAGKVLAGLDRLAKKRYVTRWARAIVYLGLGHKSAALDCLEKACEERESWIWDISINPWYDSLRDDPGFQVLLKRVGPVK